MLSDGLSYKCSAETCPGRLQTCFCNAEPRILASQGAQGDLFLSFSLHFLLFFLPFYLASTRCSTWLPLHDRKFQVLWSGYCRRDTRRNTLRALCSRVDSRKAFDNWKTRSERTDRLVSALNIKRCLKEIFTNYGYLLHSYSKLISLDVTTAILYLSWKWVI